MIVGNRGETKINARHLMATEANIMGVALRASSPEEMQITGAAMAAGIEAGMNIRTSFPCRSFYRVSQKYL